jgi:acetate---CoA ligase (ADP-forming)
MSLATLFNPRSIAVIGASTTPGSVGHIIVQNLINEHFPGKVFPVNPKAETLLGLPCYPSVKTITQPIDLAIIVVPAAIVPLVLSEVGEVGIKSAIIISAGFKEAGVNGKVLEQQVKTLVEKYSITLIGPNCLGFLHSSRSLNASFAKGLPNPGGITFFSQSGALCTTLLDQTRNSLGYAHFVSVGNKATVCEAELLEYFIQDPETSLIAFYTEDLAEGASLIRLGRHALLQNPPKPLIALKSGTTEAGSHASSSHTGAVAGSDHAYNTLFRQAMITRAKNLTHLQNLLTVFSKNSLPQGGNLAIITNAGGMGVLATDSAIKNNVTLAKLDPQTENDLGLALPTAAGIHNPIDVLGDAPANRYELALNLAAKDPGVDMLLVIVTPQAMTESVKTAEVIVKTRNTTKKPIVTVFTDGPFLAEGRSLLEQKGIAVLKSAEEAAEALASLANVSRWHASTSLVQETITSSPSPSHLTSPKPLSPKPGYLTEPTARHLLEEYGFIFPKTTILHSKEEALSAAELFTDPVVLKIISPDIIHKSDVGGVLVGVSPKDIPKKYEGLLETIRKNVPEAKIEGVLVAEMIPESKTEILLGIKEEPGLGKLLVVGMGGIYVEILADVASRFAPLSKTEALAMIGELKSFPMLLGVRGQKGIDIDLLADTLVSLSGLVTDYPTITELDINPLVPHQDGFVCLDARIKIS